MACVLLQSAESTPCLFALRFFCCFLLASNDMQLQETVSTVSHAKNILVDAIILCKTFLLKGQY